MSSRHLPSSFQQWIEDGNLVSDSSLISQMTNKLQSNATAKLTPVQAARLASGNEIGKVSFVTLSFMEKFVKKDISKDEIEVVSFILDALLCHPDPNILEAVGNLLGFSYEELEDQSMILAMRAARSKACCPPCNEGIKSIIASVSNLPSSKTATIKRSAS